MNRHTAAGDASVSLLCTTFDLSRAAYYAEARRQRGEDAPAKNGKGIGVPRRRGPTLAEVVLLAHRKGLGRQPANPGGNAQGLGEPSPRRG